MIWRSLLVPKTVANDPHGLLEINPRLFSGLSKTQISKLSTWHALYEARRSVPVNPMANHQLFILAINSWVRAEDLPVTRNFLLSKIQEVTRDWHWANAVLESYEAYFGKDYAQTEIGEITEKWEKVFTAFSDWNGKRDPGSLNIYHFGRAYMRVYPEKIAWFKDPEFKKELEEIVIAVYRYHPQFQYVPTFMRVTPTPYRDGVMPFTDVENPRQRIQNYFRFRKQLNDTLAFYRFPENQPLELPCLAAFTELIARVHQAMIYYHFWEQLNGRITRAFMSFLNRQYGLLPVILNTDALSIDQYKPSNQVGFIASRKEKLEYEPEAYRQFAQATIDWVIEQQIKTERLYLELISHSPSPKPGQLAAVR